MAEEEEKIETEETPEDPPLKEGKEVVDFDPRKPNRLTRRQLVNLSVLFDHFSANLAEHLAKELSMKMKVKIQSIAQERYEVFTNALPNPSIIYEVEFAPMVAQAMMVLQHQLIFSALDRLLGGSGDVDMEARDLTEVESGIGDRLVEGVMNSFATVWKEIAVLNPSIQNRLTDPDKVGITNAKDILLVIVMEISGETRYGALTLCFPFTALEEFNDKIKSLDEMDVPQMKGLEEWREKLEQNLVTVNVGLPMVLGEADISIREVLDLQKDDVIVLDKKISDPVEMPVGSLGVIRGNVGVFNQRLALKVIDVCNEMTEQADDQETEEETANG